MKLDRFINRPVLSTVISIIIVILGILGLVSLPVSQYPDIAPPTVRVSATYTGANAQTVLNSVVAPLEEQINGVEGMTYMTSEATSDGSASITVYFQQGVDPDMAAVNVQNRVSMATGLLPAEVTQIGVTTQKRQTSMLLIFTLTSPDDSYDAIFLNNYLQINVRPQIMRVPGVGDAMVWGSDYSMRIWLKPDVMSQYKLVPSDITNVLAEQNLEAATGSFGENGDQSFQYTIRYRGRLQKPEEFENIVVKSLPDGEVLRLKDVARIELGGLTYSIASESKKHPAVTCIIFQTPGTNATQIISDIENLLKETSKDFPPGIEYEILMNTNEFLFASIHEVIKTLLEAFILVFLVVYIFLQDFRSTLIPLIAVPVALIGTFFFLYVIGFSINLLTLFALVLAIAIVVDDAIVVVEAVHAKLDQGYQSARLASLDAMSEISGAIISITLVMAAVFIPVTFMGGTSGIFYTQFGLTLAIAIGISALNALTLSPALCAILLKPHDVSDPNKKLSVIDRFHKGFNAAYGALLTKYKNGVMRLIHHRWIAFGLVALFVVGLLGLMKYTRTGLVPNEDTGTFMIDVSLPPATSMERTEEVMNEIEDFIMANPHILGYNKVSGVGLISGRGSCYGMFICKLKPWDERNVKGGDVNSIIGQLYAQTATIKNANVLIFAPPMIAGFGVSNGFEFSVQDKTGGDLNRFAEVTNGFVAALNQRPEISRAYITFNPNFPQYMIDIDAAKAKKAGISPRDILSTLQGYYGSLYASNFNRFGKMYRVMIQADAEYRISPETLNSIYVRNSAGEMAPIAPFIDMQKIYGPQGLTRFNMFTSIAVNGSAAEGYSSGDAIRAIEEVAAQTLPIGYGYEFSGLTRDEKNSSSSTTMIFVLCIVFIYFILSAQYESYILPLVVILSIPFGLAGTFIFAQIMGIENNIYLQIGLIMLIGLLAKNAILITEFALDRRRQGMGIAWSAILGASARLRPILMTSLAMIIGLLPLMFASGVGANGNRALGTGAVGGMLIGTALQVFVVPVLFVVFEFLQERFKPIRMDGFDTSDVDTELDQYTRPKK